MARWIHAQEMIGEFVERDTDNVFEFSKNDVAVGGTWTEQWPHKVWVGGVANDHGYRFARVLKTIAYIVVDEDDYGRPVVEKWYIKKHREYA